MAEILPATFRRRWTVETPRRRRYGVLPRRLRLALFLATLALVLASTSVGVLAWWRPIREPALIVLASAPAGTVDVARTLAVTTDGTTLSSHVRANAHLVIDNAAPTRAELLHYVNMLRLAKPHDYIVLQVSAAAGLSPTGEVVLYTSDAGPTNASAALRLCDLADATAQCRGAGVLVLLDLVEASDATLAIVPPVDLAACVDSTLSKLATGNAAIVTSHSRGEQSQLAPLGNRSLFSWLADRGLRGMADGVLDSVCDGRVSSDEFIAYLQQELPPVALRTTARRQHPAVFGKTSSFDLSLVEHSPAQETSQPEYPQWLSEAWTSYAASRASASPSASAAWLRTLQSLELLALAGASEQELAPLRADLRRYSTTSRSAQSEIGPVVTALEQYLAARNDAISSTPVAQAKGIEQKLLAAFIKSHAALSPEVLGRAVTTVATEKSHAALAEWQALLAVLDAWPQPTTGPTVASLRALAGLREGDQDDADLAEASRLALLLALQTDPLANDLATWPWLRAQLDDLLNQAIHGETLLFARGFASALEARTALQQASGRCQDLLLAAREIRRLSAAPEGSRRFLEEHVYLAVADASLAKSWVDAAKALQRLEQLTAIPSAPISSDEELRRVVRDMATASAAVDAACAPLRERTSAREVTNAITACRQGDADASDLQRARLLLQSSAIPAQNRRDLWLAYLPLAAKLQTADNASDKSSPGVVANLSAIHDRRVAMHQTWNAARTNATPKTTAGSTELSLWWQDWQRYRQEELIRVCASDAPPVWSSARIEVTGPLACVALTRERPETTFDLAWEQPATSTAPLVVSAVSPNAALSVEPSTAAPLVGQPAKFRLRLREAPGQQFKDAGFLATFTSQGRSYHVPIRLPGVQAAEDISLLLSASPTRLEVLDQVPLLGDSSTVYVWAQNNTSLPRQVAVSWESETPSPPMTLAPHEIACAKLAPPSRTTMRGQLTVTARDAATQKSLANRTYKFYAPTIGDVIRMKSASLQCDSNVSAKLTIELALQEGVDTPVAAGLAPSSAPTHGALRIRGGATRIVLSPIQRSGLLIATCDPLHPADSITCGVQVEGLAGTLLLSGKFPAIRDTAHLVPQSAPSVTLAGVSVAQPSDHYALSALASNLPAGAQMRIGLHSTIDQSTLLSRELPADSPAVATLAATVPPGGLTIRPVVAPPTQTFDTTGLVGHFLWKAEVITAGQTSIYAKLPVTFDDTPPTNCRFVNSPGQGIKESVANLQVAGWDDLTEVTQVQLFVGKAVDGKAPPGVRLFSAQKSQSDAAVWNAAVTLPKELGPCEVTALLTNAVGLSAVVTATIDVVVALPIAQGEVRGVVLEGTLAQADLEVVLEKSPGATLQTTKTNPQGQFSFSGVPTGSYTVRSSKATSQRKGTAPVVVEAGQAANATIRLAL